MAEETQCPNCGKYYPDFATRRALRRTKQGRYSDGGYGCLYRVAALGLMALIVGGALWGMNTLAFDVFSHALITTLLIVGAVLTVPPVLALSLVGASPHAYQYHCKNCGKDWRVEIPLPSKQPR